MLNFADNIKNDNIFTVDDLSLILENYPVIKKYVNVSASFDIETTSFYDDMIKVGLMYEWTFGINGFVIIGRTWDEFVALCNELASELELNPKTKKLVIYVHNLSFEFQFLMKHFRWESVFALEERKPVTALTTSGIEFRCSYVLSGKSLASLGADLRTYKFDKMVGDLDYSLYRHSRTPLTEAELKYCINDVKIVMSYIQEKIDGGEYICDIPKTKTSYVRKYCRDLCLYRTEEMTSGRMPKRWYKYHKMMKALSLTPDEYLQLKRAFQGGFTHANAYHVRQTLYDVASYDFTSSYPAVMITEKFPMSQAEVIEHQTQEEFENNLKHFCCLFDIELLHVEPIINIEHPISISKCRQLDSYESDNGRLIRAKHLCTTVTEQDFLVYRKFYKWEKIRVKNFRRYIKAYLPTSFVKAILNLYQKKAALKGVAGSEEEYMLSKEMLNSCYGMCVTDIVRPTSTYADGEWVTEDVDINTAIEQYNKSARRFLSYAWGVWVTAYARRNLFTGISSVGSDYVYSDTDSIKLLHYEKHQKYFEDYNKMMMQKVDRALEYHHIARELAYPQTIKGVEKPLGVWDFEGVYDRFKTLGAKRYMTDNENVMSLTVSGLNKSITMPYLTKEYGDPFPHFDDHMYIPKGATGKMVHTYIDVKRTGSITDYLGATASYEEASGVHLEECDYSLSLSWIYLRYIRGIREREIK